jgi:hypothetical protein
VQTKRRKTLPPKRFAADSTIRRKVESAKRNGNGTDVSTIRRFEGKQGDGAAAHTDIRAAEKKLKWENYVYKIF